MSTPDGTPAAPDFSGRPVPDLSGLVSARAFHGLVKSDACDGFIVAKDFDAVEIARETKGFRFTATTGSQDRDHDVVESPGVNFDPFRKNPVILQDHNSHGTHPWPAVVGLAIDIATLKKRHDLLVEFAPDEVNPAGPRLQAMIEWRIEQKALGDAGAAMSIGFLPHEFAWDDKLGGIRFEAIEVLEASIVTIPSNRDAMRRMVADGLDLNWLVERATKTLEAAGFVVTKQEQADALAVVETLDPAKGGGSLVEVAETKETADDALPGSMVTVALSDEVTVSTAIPDYVTELAANFAKMLRVVEGLVAAPPEPVVQAPDTETRLRAFAAAYDLEYRQKLEQEYARNGHAINLTAGGHA